MIKIYTKGNFFFVVYSNNVIFTDYKQSVFPFKKNDGDTTFNFTFSTTGRSLKDIQFSDIVDETNSAYADQDTFETWLYENTGIPSSTGVGGITNLSYTASSTVGIVTSDTGTDATIPLATGTDSGLLSPAFYTILTNTSGTNTGDQTSIVGITGTKVQFDTACIDGDFAYQSDILPSTHLTTGGVITSQTTTFTVSAVVGQIVDYSTFPPTITDVTYAGASGITPNYVRTLLVIDSSGSLVQIDGTSGDLTADQRRDNIFLGGITFLGGSILAIQNTPYIQDQIHARFDDLTNVLGALNITGNIISANGSNLLINKSAGQTWRRASNYSNDRNVPDITTDVNQSPTTGTTLIGYRNGTGGWNYDIYSAITPNNWDNGSGTKQTVANNKFTIQRVYFFNGTGTFVIYLGQKEYASLDAAKAELITGIVETDPVVSLATHRSSIIVKKGTTALNNTTENYFFTVDDFSSSGGASGTINLQASYDNSISPEIITDTTRGAITVKRGSAADTDNIYEGQNGAGTVTFSVDGNGKITGTTTTQSANDNSTKLASTAYVDSAITSTSGFIPKIESTEVFRGVEYRNGSTTEDTYGGVTMTNDATSVTKTIANTTFLTKKIRKGFSHTIVSSGHMMNIRVASSLYYLGAGFRFVCTFGIPDTVYASGCRQFHGMQSSTLAPTYSDTTQVDSMTNIIGVGSESTDTNLQIFHNDASGTATKVDLGVDFPANRTSGAELTTMYSIELYNAVNGTTVLYRVVNGETGAVATGTISTNLPLSSQSLTFVSSRCMGGGGGNTNTGRLDLGRLGCYSLY